MSLLNAKGDLKLAGLTLLTAGWDSVTEFFFQPLFVMTVKVVGIELYFVVSLFDFEAAVVR
ncbi:MAG: hypothetical protein IJ681_10875, partial [Bacteroidales bacterium]|nr:hypothetical protein [Bacteroidales bacterium]